MERDLATGSGAFLYAISGVPGIQFDTRKRAASPSLEMPVEKRVHNHRSEHNQSLQPPPLSSLTGLTAESVSQLPKSLNLGTSSSSDEGTTPDSAELLAELQESGGLNLQDVAKGKKRCQYGVTQNKKMCLVCDYQKRIIIIKATTNKIILQWMKQKNLRMVAGHREAFNELLDGLGFRDKRLSDKLRRLLDIKTRCRIATIAGKMEKAGAYEVVERQGKHDEVVKYVITPD